MNLSPFVRTFFDRINKIYKIVIYPDDHVNPVKNENFYVICNCLTELCNIATALIIVNGNYSGVNYFPLLEHIK